MRLGHGAACALVVTTLACTPGGRRVERVLIPAGSSFADVVDSLDAHGLVASRAFFRLLGRTTGTDRNVKAGLYEFSASDSPTAILRALRDGDMVEVRFTVPEGFTIVDVAQLAQERLLIPRDSVLAAARDVAWLRSRGVEGSTVEGFLFPETYLLSGPVSAHELLGQMIDEFHRAWDASWDSVLRATGRSRLDVLTLASIIEGEARTDEERPIIAGVYTNRLRIGMALQADPTVQYAIQLSTGERKPRLYEKDYDIKSLYNTYLHRGLPPGPVGAPGRKSIEAALFPAAVRYLYFVADGSGRHVFSRTYDEHLRMVRKTRPDH